MESSVLALCISYHRTPSNLPLNSSCTSVLISNSSIAAPVYILTVSYLDSCGLSLSNHAAFTFCLRLSSSVIEDRDGVMSLACFKKFLAVPHYLKIKWTHILFFQLLPFLLSTTFYILQSNQPIGFSQDTLYIIIPLCFFFGRITSSNPWVVSTNYLKPKSSAVASAYLPCHIIRTNHFLLYVSTHFSHASVSAVSYYSVNFYMPVLLFRL